jgi:hypothetical protein
MTDPIIDDFKSFDWQKIMDYGCSLDDLNSSQWKFLKGMALELAIERFADKDLSYVGLDHKDFDWPKHNISVEAKTQFSEEMYTKKGELRKSFSVVLNNSRGTNKKTTLSADQVADYILVVRKDGAFVIDKQTVMRKSNGQGDGFTLRVSSNEITVITEPIKGTGKKLYIKEKVMKILRESTEEF